MVLARKLIDVATFLEWYSVLRAAGSITLRVSLIPINLPLHYNRKSEGPRDRESENGCRKAGLPTLPERYRARSPMTNFIPRYTRSDRLELCVLRGAFNARQGSIIRLDARDRWRAFRAA